MQTETASTPLKPRLRWYQYRLRTLLILMTLLAVWMSWISHRARQQKFAVEKIQALGGTVNYDYQKITGDVYHFNDQASPSGPEWLRKLFGDEYFQNVVWVTLSKTTVTDDDLAILKNLTDLKGLNLNETKITGSGLVHLTGLKNLQCLLLDKTLVEDCSLVHLRNLISLRYLSLNSTRITDAGMINLHKLTNLEDVLWLENTQITDEGLKHLNNLKKLKVLILFHTQVTEKGIKNLQNDLPNIKIAFDMDN
jgi:hypothetical protein